MNIQQLEYIVAVDRYRHFVQAAQHCHITQPTLSMMIRKLEDELGVKIFDRARQPIVPTDIGVQVIAQAQTILLESQRLTELAHQYNGLMAGELRVGVIPTVAPYLLPRFIQHFMGRYPAIHLQVTEMITEKVLHELKQGTIDVGIIATATSEGTFHSLPLYREKLFVYASEQVNLYEKKYILPDDIDPNELWLLEEGHCFRTQIQKLCELSRAGATGLSFTYRAGNIETLIRMVERSGGLTIIPELAVHDLDTTRMAHVREFQAPSPAREIQLIYTREHVKTRLIDVFSEEIRRAIPAGMQVQKVDVQVL